MLNSRMKTLAFYTLCFLNILFTGNSQSFFKHHFEVIFERANINNLNETIAFAEAFVPTYNRTARPLNLKFKLLQDIYGDSIVSFSAYQFRSNEYRLTVLQFAMKIEKAMKLVVAGFHSLLNKASPPIKWPLQKGVIYSVKNWLPNNQDMPFPYAPTGKWKGIISFYKDNKVTKAFDIHLYYRIEDIPDV